MSEKYADSIYKFVQKSITPYVATGNITKSIDHEKKNDMKHDGFEVVANNDRQQRVKFSSKQNLKRQRYLNFLPQE